jgi:hypothetical protein
MLLTLCISVIIDQAVNVLICKMKVFLVGVTTKGNQTLFSTRLILDLAQVQEEETG